MPHDQLDNLVKVGQRKTRQAMGKKVSALMSSGIAQLHDTAQPSEFTQ